MTIKSFLKPAGIKSLKQFLQNELYSLQQAPILLVTSEPGAVAVQVPLTPVSDASRMVQFILSQQLGLRTIPATISAALPTTHDLKSRLDLLRRTGASSIVAVGSGAAMDLAKALASEKKDAIEHLILVPSTYGGVFASGASHSLILDTVEETMVPSPVTTTSTCLSTEEQQQPAYQTIVAPLESKYTASMGLSSHVLYASLAIVLDAGLRKSHHPLLDGLVQDLNRFCVEGDPAQERSHDELLDLCYRSGEILSYGPGSEDRSAPMALAASLIPPIFPHIHIITFWASLLPGLCHALRVQSESASASGGDSIQKLATSILANHTDWLKNVPKLTVEDDSRKGFSVPDMALSQIQANATVWKCYDLPNNVLTQILQQSL